MALISSCGVISDGRENAVDGFFSRANATGSDWLLHCRGYFQIHQLFGDSKRIDTKQHLSCNANVIFNVSLQMIYYYLFHPSQRLQKMLPSVRIMWIAMVYSMQE